MVCPEVALKQYIILRAYALNKNLPYLKNVALNKFALNKILMP